MLVILLLDLWFLCMTQNISPHLGVTSGTAFGESGLILSSFLALAKTLDLDLALDGGLALAVYVAVVVTYNFIAISVAWFFRRRFSRFWERPRLLAFHRF